MASLLPLLLSLPAAHAHGGFHESQDVGEVDQPGDRPAVVTNYGLIIPVEDSPDWAWVCEEVVGPQGFSATLQLGDRWLLASFDGVLVSDDLCDWRVVRGELEGLYVTGLYADKAVADRIWATSASGDAENALWRSDDRGETWHADASFGAGTTLRGMGQDDGGLPMWTIGWDDVTPTVWITTDGSAWQGHALPTDDVYSVAILGVADGSAYARLAGAHSDGLVRIGADASLTELYRFDDVITAFDAGPGPGQLYVGGKVLGLAHSADGGQTWSDPQLAPQPGCLRTRGSERFICGHNWSDGAAVLRTSLDAADPEDWEWEDVLWFGDVRGVVDCPADSHTAQACDALWENASPEAGFDVDPETDGGADDAGADSGSSPEPTAGCCSGSKASALLLLPGLLGLGAIRRRR